MKSSRIMLPLVAYDCPRNQPSCALVVPYFKLLGENQVTTVMYACRSANVGWNPSGMHRTDERQNHIRRILLIKVRHKESD